MVYVNASSRNATLVTINVGNYMKSMKMQQKTYGPHHKMPESLKNLNLLKHICTYSQLWGMRLASVTKSAFLLEAFSYDISGSCARYCSCSAVVIMMQSTKQN